ncbi:MAG: histidinol dehydrogenase [Spirochaeta sp.]|nr:histidinol dehydrogenase [Spirochaeta sp.]
MQIAMRRWNEISDEDRSRLLARSEQDINAVMPQIQELIDMVRTEGDQALLRLTERFDKADLSKLGLRVSEAEFQAAEAHLPEEVKEALRYAVENVRRYHEPQHSSCMSMQEIRPGIIGGERFTPIDSVGLYVPGGRGSFPSMLYMLAVPANIAGVPRIVVVTPPLPDGTVDPASLYAARLCGVDEVYRVGGAQAIAALAFGTETIPKVLKMEGPGSMYVTAAKRLLTGNIDIGMPAGPSESIVLADAEADPWKVALDLLIEAEHGSDSSALLVTHSTALAEAVAALVPDMVADAPEPRRTFLTDVLTGYGGILISEDLQESADIVNQFAPEHLQIQTRDPFQTLSLIRNASEILLGEHAAFSLANYAAGANAVLPTGGNARTYSPVSVHNFQKMSSVVYISEEAQKAMQKHVVKLADHEGFYTHAAALRRRNESLT